MNYCQKFVHTLRVSLVQVSGQTQFLASSVETFFLCLAHRRVVPFLVRQALRKDRPETPKGMNDICYGSVKRHCWEERILFRSLSSGSSHRLQREKRAFCPLLTASTRIAALGCFRFKPHANRELDMFENDGVLQQGHALRNLGINAFENGR